MSPDWSSGMTLEQLQKAGIGGQLSGSPTELVTGVQHDSRRVKPGDLLTAIRLPKTWAGANFYFEKVADRNVWDFALVNISAALKVNNGTIEDSRIVCGGVQARPKRLSFVEDIIKGSPQNEETAELAGKSATRGATPLNFNHYKIPLMKNLVMRAIRDA